MKKSPFLILFFTLIFFSLALPGAWTTERLSNMSGISIFPAIAVSGSNVYVAWTNDTTGNNEIYFKRSTDNGATWKDSKQLTTSGTSMNLAIAASGSSVYVAWFEGDTGNNEIYFKRSTDSGATWKAAKRLTSNSGDSRYPAIAASGSNVYVAWEDDSPGDFEIHFRRSADNGATWLTAKKLTNNLGSSTSPAIAASGSNVCVTWQDMNPGNEEVYFRRSADNGATWLTAKRLTNNLAVSGNPDMAASGSNVQVIWQDDRLGAEDDEIHYRQSTDNGAIWLANKRLTTNTVDSQYPAIAVNGSNVCAVWQEEFPADYRIYCKRSTDGGASWGYNTRLTYYANPCTYPDVAVSASKIYVVWSYGAYGDSNIYMAYSPL